MPKRHKLPPKKHGVSLFFDCPCGNKHIVKLQRGEAEIIYRGTCGRSIPPGFQVKHLVLEPKTTVDPKDAAAVTIKGKNDSAALCDTCPPQKVASCLTPGDPGPNCGVFP